MSTDKGVKKKFLELYKASCGAISTSALALGIHRTTFYKWLQSDEDFANTVKQLDESFVENVEAKVIKKIEEGSDLWVWRYLKAHRPERWKEEVKHTQEHGGTLKLEIVNKTIGLQSKEPETPHE
jgi:hypothetical protein